MVALYLYMEQGGVESYSWCEDRAALPLHGGMPLLEQGEAERHRQGVGRP
jgi:hypothetical protein